MGDPKDNEAPPTFQESVAAAMRRSGIGRVAPGEVPSASSLLAAVGGVRGIIEAVLPGLGFLVVYSVLTNVVPQGGVDKASTLWLSVLAPLAVALVFVIIRLATRTPGTQAFAGIFLLAISAILALVTGKAENNFVPGFFINGIFLLAILVSLVARWPVIGIIAGFLTNEGTSWRSDKAKYRVLVLATWLWAGLFALRLVVELPLYFAHETSWLAGARLITGVPLYAGMLWITWLLVRAVYARAQLASAVDPD
jgi:hypothetical protein